MSTTTHHPECILYSDHIGACEYAVSGNSTTPLGNWYPAPHVSGGRARIVRLQDRDKGEYLRGLERRRTLLAILSNYVTDEVWDYALREAFPEE